MARTWEPLYTGVQWENCRHREPKWLKWETCSPVASQCSIKYVLLGHNLKWSRHYSKQEILTNEPSDYGPINIYALCRYTILNETLKNTYLATHLPVILTVTLGHYLLKHYPLQQVFLPHFCHSLLSYFEPLNLGQIFIHFSLAAMVDCMLGNYRAANLLCSKIFLKRKDPLCSQEIAF